MSPPRLGSGGRFARGWLETAVGRDLLQVFHHDGPVADGEEALHAFELDGVLADEDAWLSAFDAVEDFSCGSRGRRAREAFFEERDAGAGDGCVGVST